MKTNISRREFLKFVGGAAGALAIVRFDVPDIPEETEASRFMNALLRYGAILSVTSTKPLRGMADDRDVITGVKLEESHFKLKSINVVEIVLENQEIFKPGHPEYLTITFKDTISTVNYWDHDIRWMRTTVGPKDTINIDWEFTIHNKRANYSGRWGIINNEQWKWLLLISAESFI